MNGIPKEYYYYYRYKAWMRKAITCDLYSRFLTKIKMRDEKASRALQKLQNRINAVHHQVELDKRKAKLDGKRGKLLYKPRKKEHLESVPVRDLLIWPR